MFHNKTFFGHPRSLRTLFHIELWERFSFYGMQAILMIYLYYELDKGGLGVDKSLASSIVGAYGASVYLATILGAWLADRVTGLDKMLLSSAVVVMCGHIALGILTGFSGLLFGLVLVALGSGGIKASANAIVGSLYETDALQSRRDAGFSIFYIAINIGALAGPLVIGYLQTHFGFHYGFAAAAVGMALALGVYIKGRALLPDTTKVACHPLTAKQRLNVLGIVAVLLLLLGGLIFSGSLHWQNVKQSVMWLALLLSMIYFVRLLTSKHLASENKRVIFAYLPLFLATALFWALWFQFYTAITVYFDETAQRQLGQFTLPVAWLHSLQGLWVIVFSGLLAILWTKLGKHQPKTPIKFALGLILVGLAFWLFIPYLHRQSAMPLLMIAFAVWVLTIGELCLSPISLSLATKIAPPALKAQFVALNFLSFSLGFSLGGRLAEQYFRSAPLTGDASCSWLFCSSFTQEIDFYYLIGALGIAGGILLLMLSPVLNRLLKNID